MSIIKNPKKKTRNYQRIEGSRGVLKDYGWWVAYSR
jgi:hypothetical protein